MVHFSHASRIGPEMFEGEALGLKAMYDTKSIRVPLPYNVSEVADSALCSTSAYVDCISINVVILLHDQNCGTDTQLKYSYSNSESLRPSYLSY